MARQCKLEEDGSLMRIYVIRHGISESNKSMTYSEPETRLAPEAARQLRSVKKKLKSVPFERVYASDLSLIHI